MTSETSATIAGLDTAIVGLVLADPVVSERLAAGREITIVAFGPTVAETGRPAHGIEVRLADGKLVRLAPATYRALNRRLEALAGTTAGDEIHQVALHGLSRHQHLACRHAAGLDA